MFFGQRVPTRDLAMLPWGLLSFFEAAIASNSNAYGVKP